MKKLGVVTKEEINQLNDFINERAALCDLILSIGRAKELGIDLEENTTYKQLVHDMKMVRKNIENWWKETAERYNWEYQPNDTWNFNTDTGEIFLNQNMTLYNVIKIVRRNGHEKENGIGSDGSRIASGTADGLRREERKCRRFFF